ncbi:MAG TPA: universal stress protein [Actinomycetes bacterium]|nr:universal stress protein [Actinomycetes bacterium]
MTPSVVSLEPSGRSRQVGRAADALAAALGMAVEHRGVPAGSSLPDLLADCVDRIVVLPHSPSRPDPVLMDRVGRVSAPVLLVPTGPRYVAPERVSCVLVPLDASLRSARTVAETVELFAASGAEIVVLHVFEAETVPRFWDQPVHARRSWGEEFLARYCDQPGARVELRAGVTGEHIRDVADRERADVITLGWAQDTSPGRARTVRSTLRGAHVPVLLLPVLGEAGEGEWP